MPTGNTTTTTTADAAPVATVMSDAMRTALTTWSDTLRNTERSGAAAILQSETDAFNNLVNDLASFGAWLTSDVLPLVATITGDAVESITGDKVRACMARTGTAMSCDDDTRKNFPSASTISRALSIHANDTAEWREQWLTASATSATGKVTRNPRRVQDYAQVIAVANGAEHGNKSAIDWRATLSGGTYNPRTRKYTRKGDKAVVIGLMVRKDSTPDAVDTDTVTESTDASVVIPAEWRDLFGMADDSLTAIRNDADGYNVEDFAPADRILLARQLLADIIISTRAAQRVTA